MRSIFALAAALLAACSAASAIPDTFFDMDVLVNNATQSWMPLDEATLTEIERETLKKLEEERDRRIAKRGLDKRFCGGPSNIKQTKLVGNGNPHQNYYFQQVTGDLGCEGTAGSISHETDTSWSWSASLGGQYSWISGGFSVSKSYGQSQTETVNCLKTDTQICIYQKIAHTAYTVQPQICTAACQGGLICTNSGHPIVFFSPNSNQYGGCFFKGTNNRIGCANAIGGCPGEHIGFWKKCGQPGGDPGHIVCGAFGSKTCGKSC